MNTFKIEQEPKIKTGFSVPQHYFDEIDSKIIGKINDEKVIYLPARKKIYKWYYAAAATLIIGFSTFIYYNNATAEVIADEEYLTVYENLSTEDLTEFLSEQDVQSLENTLIDYNLQHNLLQIENL